MISEQVIRAAEAFVQEQLSGTDGSHDYFHIQRVRANASRLAREEGCDADEVALADLSALLHDVKDWKYSGDENATQAAVQEFLGAQGLDAAVTAKVVSVIASVGFKEELGAKGLGASGGGGGGGGSTLSKVAAVVQDADRLDAIGAVGIARCFTFGGRFNRTLHDPSVPPRTNGLTKEAYILGAAKSTTINHFYEKLLKLKGLMKTSAGRAAAEARHAVMEDFLRQFHLEVEGKA